MPATELDVNGEDERTIYVAAREIVDQKGQLVVSVNIVVGDDEELFANPRNLVSWKVK